MKAIREARGISLRRLAKDIGKDPGFLSRVENDKQGAGDELLHLYAAYLNVPIAAITHKEKTSDQERPGSPHRNDPDPPADGADRSSGPPRRGPHGG
ncbi:helix-turn-helix domain-containing protein [Streptomyces sp. NPDC057052]|uniref:helix-turn-helix domain-containing protein n=1 Tax=Streptomyces sp. NPDC057052 TaxID=3346010 RepID=UPI003643C5DB